ncbi:putative amidoligase enzyme-domain-containing protein [Xylaria telfairii]|nr:putative amidoligase enzyme-domain-containing protein [Xylaria telfairii]
MASNQQNKTFTVPVGTRLSHGIELEMLVAYLYTSENDPDAANSENLAPITRVGTSPIGSDGDIDSAMANQDAAHVFLQDHIRRTLRNHGIRVNGPGPVPTNEDLPHLTGVDQWDVGVDASVTSGMEEIRLTRDKPGSYRWLGVELRSPACWDVPRAYDEIRFVVNLMKSKYRVRVNLSCGFHVHVANGPRYFDAKTLKRAGAFFFAADPMLSRLHAPWRRIGYYTPSIRHVSRLAQLDDTRPIHEQMPTDRAAVLFRGERPSLPYPNSDYLPVVPWSDRSREELDFGGKEKGGMAKWEQHANERVRNGPYMTLNERPSTPESRTESEHSMDSRPPSLPSSSDHDDDDNDDDDNEGGAHYRRLLRLMATSGFRATCNRELGHERPERLRTREQYTLLALNRCEHLFGHASVNLLSDSQYKQLVDACAPYTEVGWSAWEWDSQTNEFTLRDGSVGTKLHHSRPKTLRQTNGKEVVLNLEAKAAVQEAEGEQRALQQREVDARVPDNDDDSDDEDVTVDKNVYKDMLYQLVERLMTQPTFPLDNVEELLDMIPGNASNASNPGTDTNDGYNPPSSRALAAAYPDGNNGAPPGSLGSDSSSDNGGDFNPPAFETYMASESDNHEASEEDSQPSSPFLSNVSPPRRNRRIAGGPKLRPHDFYQLPTQYIMQLSSKFGFPASRYRRISWLPYPGGPPDPAETHPRGSEDCRGRDCSQHAITDTRAGLATILGVDSGAAVSQLLIPIHEGDRANYNLGPYELFLLLYPGDKRTIEFREAGGSLDAEWIITWVNICIGILRFCRDASPLDFINVLERIVREEEAQRNPNQDRSDEDIYDVCDLLEDICLFTEATTVRERERKFGPPR